MTKGRLEAFSDGVIAIIITIMVLEIHAPEGATLADLRTLFTPFISYLVSFILVGTYWNNHHHLLQATDRINGRILWANLLFLFVFSLIPVSVSWINKTNFAALPTRVYIILNIMVSLCYMLLQRVIVRGQGEANRLRSDVTFGRKEKWTLFFEAIALIAAFTPYMHNLAYVCLIVSVLFWILPDLRIARTYCGESSDEEE